MVIYRHWLNQLPTYRQILVLFLELDVILVDFVLEPFAEQISQRVVCILGLSLSLSSLVLPLASIGHEIERIRDEPGRALVLAEVRIEQVDVSHHVVLLLIVGIIKLW